MKSDHPISTKDPADLSAPDGWRWERLSEIARLESGHTPSRREPSYWGGDVAWLSLKDIRSLDGPFVCDTEDHPTAKGVANSSARILPAGTVAFCRTASVGKVAILGREMATSQDFVNWVCSDALDPKYLYWALRASQSLFDKEKTGTTHKTIYMPTLERFAVLLPELPEQKRIAAILENADSARRKRRQTILLTDKLLRSAFLEIFGDPVVNPKGWHVMELSTMTTDSQYGTSVRANARGDGVPVLRMNNITYDGGFDLSELKYCVVELRDRERHMLRKRDLLFNRTNSPELVGKAAVWDRDGDFAFAGYLIRFRFDETKILPEYVSAALNSANGKRLLFNSASPSNNMSNISASTFGRLRIAVPPLDLQRQFVDIAEAIKANRSRLSTLADYVDMLCESLSQQAFRGEL